MSLPSPNGLIRSPKALNKKQLEGLIAAGAFDSMNPNRALLTANIETLTRHGASHSAAQSSGQGGCSAVRVRLLHDPA